MPGAKFPYGKPVKLLADYQGYPDGRLILFEIWRQRNGKEEKVFEVYGVTKGGKGVGTWNPEPPQVKERKKGMPLEEKTKSIPVDEKFYFIAKIDDKQVKSEDFSFTYPLCIFLKDEAGNPVNDAECTVTFSDGSSKKGTLKNGYVRFEEAPPGKFTIKLKEHEFVFQK